MEKTTAIVLAAGKGTRMKSAMPKVMHRVAGLPIVYYVVQAAIEAGCGEIVVVVGHGRGQVEEYLARAFAPTEGARSSVRTAVQDSQRGTGDAARVGLEAVDSREGRILVLNGDVPLLRGQELKALLERFDRRPAPGFVFATCQVEDPTGYGRVIRQDGNVLCVREERDLRGVDERALREINAGIYATAVPFLREALGALLPNNAQGELYLTDTIAFACSAGKSIETVQLGEEVLAGINDREQLALAEGRMRERIRKRWRSEGVTVRDGAAIDAAVTIEPDATIESGVVLRGHTRIGRGAVVDVGCVLTDVDVGEGAHMKPYTVATDSRVGPRAEVGPFAHLRPKSELGESAHVGNFVETKKTRMGRGSKANHLAYLGDGVIGAGANVGAGTIFCNYDGFQKHTTTIGEGAFIGSDSQLVAPVTVGANAYVGTGTTVTRDVPPDALAIGRAKQENKEGYAIKLRAKLRASKEAQVALEQRPHEGTRAGAGAEGHTKAGAPTQAHAKQK